MSVEQVRECYERIAKRGDMIAEHFKDIRDEINGIIEDLLKLLEVYSRENSGRQG